MRPELCGKQGLARPPHQTTYAAHDEQGERGIQGGRKLRQSLVDIGNKLK